jgi:transposase-like protein
MAMAQRMGRDLAKETHWRKRLKAQAASGLSIAHWCRQNKISTSLFYFWKRTIIHRDGSHGKPMETAAASKASVTFARVQLTPPAQTIAAAAPCMA